MLASSTSRTTRALRPPVRRWGTSVFGVVGFMALTIQNGTDYVKVQRSKTPRTTPRYRHTTRTPVVFTVLNATPALRSMMEGGRTKRTNLVHLAARPLEAPR